MDHHSNRNPYVDIATFYRHRNDFAAFDKALSRLLALWSMTTLAKEELKFQILSDFA
jgi:hypothetical protein